MSANKFFAIKRMVRRRDREESVAPQYQLQTVCSEADVEAKILATLKHERIVRYTAHRAT